MQQIRIASTRGISSTDGQRFVCEWMEASLMNRWFLKTRLAEAVALHGPESHWVETREKVRVEELAPV